jgi:hypothetical protein
LIVTILILCVVNLIATLFACLLACVAISGVTETEKRMRDLLALVKLMIEKMRR